MSALQRRALLVELIKLRRPVTVIREELSRYEWDSPEVVRMRAADIVEVLDRFLEGDLSAEDIETWADAIECRDDVDYDEVKDVVWELANPAITHSFGREEALVLRKRLGDRT